MRPGLGVRAFITLTVLLCPNMVHIRVGFYVVLAYKHNQFPNTNAGRCREKHTLDMCAICIQQALYFTTQLDRGICRLLANDTANQVTPLILHIDIQGGFELKFNKIPVSVGWRAFCNKFRHRILVTAPSSLIEKKSVRV